MGAKKEGHHFYSRLFKLFACVITAGVQKRAIFIGLCGISCSKKCHLSRVGEREVAVFLVHLAVNRSGLVVAGPLRLVFGLSASSTLLRG